MDPLLAKIVDLTAMLSPAKIEVIAEQVYGRTVSESRATVGKTATTPAARSGLKAMLEAWEGSGVSGDVLSGMLLGASSARRRMQHDSRVELVWTGPTTPFVATRRTDQVLLDIIRGAENDLFLVSFVAYDIPALVAEMNAAVDRDVDVRFLLESSGDHGGSLSHDPIATMRQCVPAALIYAWTERTAHFVDGRVHAKVAVSDGTRAFLTSANLTGYAMEKNMEAGVLFTGGHMPIQLRSHLHALIETGVVRLVR